MRVKSRGGDNTAIGKHFVHTKRYDPVITRADRALIRAKTKDNPLFIRVENGERKELSAKRE